MNSMEFSNEFIRDVNLTLNDILEPLKDSPAHKSLWGCLHFNCFWVFFSSIFFIFNFNDKIDSASLSYSHCYYVDFQKKRDNENTLHLDMNSYT